MSDVSNWSEAAAQWIAWVRTKDHDPFWAYEAAFEAFVGEGGGEGLELGAGEGRISRVLGRLGWRMTLAEPVPALLDAAREARSGVAYLDAPAHRVPLDDGRFDLVVLYNVLMDVDDLERTVAEAARLLSPEGRLIAGIVHPIGDVVHDREKPDGGVSYFDPSPFDDEIVSNGLTMRFRGWRRPLSHYVNALAAAGLVIARMDEPAPDPAHPATARLPDTRKLPLFLWLELRKSPLPKPPTPAV